MDTFPEFLKKYSTIPNQFIDDFFKLFDYKNINSEEKIVDLDNVVKWLESNKHKLKKTIINSYKENIDYSIKKVEKNTKGGKKKEIILLTIDCFKMICQSTQSKKGKEVRRYFIEVEKLMNKYKDYIIQGLENKVKAIEKGQKPKVNPQKGVIYVFKTPDTPENGLYKIGRSTSFKKRVSTHQSPLAHDIDIIFIQETDDVIAVEKCVKAFMKKKQYRKYKEIYQVDIDVIKMTINGCEQLKSKINETIDLKETKEGGFKYYMMIQNENENFE